MRPPSRTTPIEPHTCVSGVTCSTVKLCEAAKTRPSFMKPISVPSLDPIGSFFSDVTPEIIMGIIDISSTHAPAASADTLPSQRSRIRSNRRDWGAARFCNWRTRSRTGRRLSAWFPAWQSRNADTSRRIREQCHSCSLTFLSWRDSPHSRWRGSALRALFCPGRTSLPLFSSRNRP